MKKSLFAIAAATAFAGAAQAQSSVTVYGVLDAGYSDTEKTVAGVSNSQKAFTNSNYTSSRFGLRGTEDLGGGMRAGFIIESGIGSHPMAGFYQSGSNASTKAGATLSSASPATAGTDHTIIGNREFGVNLSTASGTTVSVGFGTTAIRRLVLAYDAAGGTNLIGNVLTNDATLSSNRSTGAGVAQKLGDFTVAAGVSSNVDSADGKQDVKTSTGWIGSLDYAKGPAAFGLARQVSKTNALAVTGDYITFTTASGTTTPTRTATCSASTTVACTTITAAVSASDVKRTIDIAGASYDLGVVKLFAQYAKVKIDDSLTVNAAGEGTRTATTLGVTAPVGKFTLHALASNGSQNMVVSATSGAPVKRDLTGYNVGARYALSKRTFGYAAYGETKLDGTSGVTNELKTQQTTVGLVHSF